MIYQTSIFSHRFMFFSEFQFCVRSFTVLRNFNVWPGSSTLVSVLHIDFSVGSIRISNKLVGMLRFVFFGGQSPGTLLLKRWSGMRYERVRPWGEARCNAFSLCPLYASRALCEGTIVFDFCRINALLLMYFGGSYALCLALEGCFVSAGLSSAAICA